MADSLHRDLVRRVLAIMLFSATLLTVRPLLAADGAVSSAAADVADATGAAAEGAAPASGQGGDMQTVVVMAQRLNVARSEIEVQTGASTYTVSSEAIAGQPGGENVPLSQVLLQMPDVVQDSFGQVHVRGDHNDLQYRINGIIIPEGISVFGQSLTPRFISSISLITGALPAEYGLRTAGIVDFTTNSGTLAPGGSVSVYGGSHGTFQPAAEYGGTVGSFNYYFLGDYKETDLGIESPTPSPNPIHDYSSQIHAFSYFENIFDAQNRAALVLGIADQAYQIPNQVGLQPTLGYDVNGVSMFPSENLDETQHELAEYAVLSWQHAAGALNWQLAVSARYSSLHFSPDWVGDLLYNGIAQDAFKSDLAIGLQEDTSYRVNDSHTVRAGFYLQHDSATSNTNSQILELDAAGMQISNVPTTIQTNSTQSQQIQSAYLQDEWQVLKPLTINYGLRFDHYTGFSSGSEWEPRINFVWQAAADTVVHGGYSRYFTPPPFELVSSASLAQFIGTSALPPGSLTLNTPPLGDVANYYDLGLQQKLFTQSLTLGIDAFYQDADHLIDEGQFGAPIILTPFNYRFGYIKGIEFTGTYNGTDLSAYANLAFQSAEGSYIESAQFNFTPADYNYIAANYIHLDHEGRVSASGGVAYQWFGTRYSADFIFGTGLRQALILPDGSTIPNGDHTPSYTSVNLGATHSFRIEGRAPLTLQLAIINVFDKVYQIRSGTGIGVFAPQYGAPRGFYGGLAWEF